jgi:hypothetical protein
MSIPRIIDIKPREWAGNPVEKTSKPSEISVDVKSKAWAGNPTEKTMKPGEMSVDLKPNNWGDIAGVQPPNVIRQFMGINTLDPFSIEDNTAVKNKNLSTDHFPTASTRKGYSLLGAVTGETTGLGVWKESELQAISGGVWRKWTGAAWTTIASSLNATAKWTFTNFKGNFTAISLVAANGVDPVKVYDGSTLKNLENAPAGMNFLVGHENRLYGAVKNVLHYSALRLPTDWTTVDQSGQIEIENNGGENITSVLNGTGKIVVFMGHSMHELYGTGPINYRLQLISDEIGCVNHHSAINVGGTMFFLSHDGIYRYGGGAVPKKDFSLPVQNIIDRVNTKAWDKVVAGTDSERYYISLPIDGATTPNITLEYDPKFQTWNIWDYGFVPSSYARIEETMYVGSVSNKVVKVGGTTDAGAAIPFSLETKPFSSPSLAANNRLYRLWVVADVPAGSILTISISTQHKDGLWTPVKTIQSSSDLTGTQILIPVNLLYQNKWFRLKLEGTGPVIIHEITRQERTFKMGIGGV